MRQRLRIRADAFACPSQMESRPTFVSEVVDRSAVLFDGLGLHILRSSEDPEQADNEQSNSSELQPQRTHAVPRKENQPTLE